MATILRVPLATKYEKRRPQQPEYLSSSGIRLAGQDVRVVGKQTDFPNPRGKRFPIDGLTWRHRNVQMIGLDARLAGKQFDWQNPQRRVSHAYLFRSSFQGPLLFVAVAASPFTPLQWNNPQRRAFGLHDGPQNLLPLSAVPLASPFVPLDVINPQRRAFGVPVAFVNLQATTLAPVAPAGEPFAFHAWNNPQRVQYPAGLQVLSFFDPTDPTPPPTPPGPSFTFTGGGGGWIIREEELRTRKDRDEIRARLQEAFTGVKEAAVPAEVKAEVLEVKREYTTRKRIDWKGLLADVEAVNQALQAYERVKAYQDARKREDDAEHQRRVTLLLLRH